MGDDELTPRKSFVDEELHLATIPLVGRFENNSLFIHCEYHIFTCLGSSVLRVIGTSNPHFWSWVKSDNSSLFDEKIWNARNARGALASIDLFESEINSSFGNLEL